MVLQQFTENIEINDKALGDISLENNKHREDDSESNIITHPRHEFYPLFCNIKNTLTKMSQPPGLGRMS